MRWAGLVRSVSIALALASASEAWCGERPKVVILGFDGADARLVEQYMAAGELPNLARLRDRGHVRSAPADEPAADAGVLVLIRHRDLPG